MIQHQQKPLKLGYFYTNLFSLRPCSLILVHILISVVLSIESFIEEIFQRAFHLLSQEQNEQQEHFCDPSLFFAKHLQWLLFFFLEINEKYLERWSIGRKHFM